MFDLALAVDRRIRDDRHGLLQEVGEVRALHRERCERTVITERPDGLVRGLLHEGRLLQILGVVAEGRELLLAADRDVVDLVGHDLELHAAASRLHRPIGSDSPDRRTAGLEAEPIAVRCAAALGPQGDEPRSDLALAEVVPAA